MAYKTAEEKHQKQADHEGSFSVENKLQQYLRDKFTPDTLNESTLHLLVQIATDYDLKVGIQRSDDAYYKLATDAVKTFKENYKKHPTNNKGQQLGKAVVATLQGLKY